MYKDRIETEINQYPNANRCLVPKGPPNVQHFPYLQHPCQTEPVQRTPSRVCNARSKDSNAMLQRQRQRIANPSNVRQRYAERIHAFKETIHSSAMPQNREQRRNHPDSMERRSLSKSQLTLPCSTSAPGGSACRPKRKQCKVGHGLAGCCPICHGPLCP